MPRKRNIQKPVNEKPNKRQKATGEKSSDIYMNEPNEKEAFKNNEKEEKSKHSKFTRSSQRLKNQISNDKSKNLGNVEESKKSMHSRTVKEKTKNLINDDNLNIQSAKVSKTNKFNKNNKKCQPKLSDQKEIKINEDGSKTISFAGNSISFAECDATNKTIEDENSEESENEWEEVEDLPFHEENKSQIPKEPIEIILKAPQIWKRKDKIKKQFDWKAFLQTQINKFQKRLRINMHKVHLLCLLAHGLHLNHTCNNLTLQAQMFSLLPIHMTSWNPAEFEFNSLEKFLKWFRSVIFFDCDNKQNKIEPWKDKLTTCFQNNKTFSEVELVLLFVIALRALRIEVRIILSFQPLSLKPDMKKIPKKNNSKKRCNKESSEVDCSKEKIDGKNLSKKKQSVSKTKAKHELDSNGSSTDEDSENQNIEENNNNNKKKQKLLARPKNTRKRTIASKLDSSDEEMEFKKASIRSKRSCTLKNTPIVDVNDEDDCEILKSHSRKKQADEGKKDDSPVDVSSGSDFELEVISNASSSKSKKKSSKMISSESEEEVKVLLSSIPEKGLDHWIEIYLPSKEKWICIDCVNKTFNKPTELEKNATQPLTYVIAFDNAGAIKDVTQRYASLWMTHTRKMRVESDWWKAALTPFKSSDIERDTKETKELSAHLMSKSLPATINEYKNHPLYVLQRHLLKFEALYPPTVKSLGSVRGESVYPRECVHTLHTRETWIKDAKVVKIGEQPYKMVKARPKWNKPNENKDELTLPVFGHWQTEDYVPLPAVDGKVPRNEYGNVELFKPCMLPGGTVHLPLAGLNRVARKLGIDCAPAMVGWDFHGGSSHPVFDGFVVCEDVKETLIAAWNQDQEETRKKDEEKRDKRIYGNWKKLIRGLLIRERLKNKFNLKPAEEMTENSKEAADDAQKSWPRNRQDESLEITTKDPKQLFPFEKL